jgi:hypothetical protein
MDTSQRAGVSARRQATGYQFPTSAIAWWVISQRYPELFERISQCVWDRQSVAEAAWQQPLWSSKTSLVASQSSFLLIYLVFPIHGRDCLLRVPFILGHAEHLLIFRQSNYPCHSSAHSSSRSSHLLACTYSPTIDGYVCLTANEVTLCSLHGNYKYGVIHSRWKRKQWERCWSVRAGSRFISKPTE